VTLTDLIQAGAGIASVLVAVAAVVVAWKAARVAADANKISEDARDIARSGVSEGRRQAKLAAVPHLAIEAVNLTGVSPAPYRRLRLRVYNGGPTVAYGVLASVAGAPDRSLDSIVETTRHHSGRQVAVGAEKELGLAVRVEFKEGSREAYEWLAIQLEYYGPLGARVRQDYLWPTDPRKRLFRMHRVSIDPRDGGPPEEFDLALGRFPEDETEDED
jgi:hypothetical protein